MNYLIKNLFRGIVITVPVAVTIYVIWWVVRGVDRLLNLKTTGLDYPGVGFLITVAGLILIGILASNIVGRSLFGWMEKLFVRAPIIKIVYTSVRDLIEAFVGDRRRFNRPVVVSFPPDASVRSFGFVTRDELDFLELRDQVVVYMPQSYNIAGNLLVVPSAWVRPLDVDASNLMAFIVSGGVSGM